MFFPDKIPVERIEDYHTHYIGRYAGGNQFWGYETFVYTKKPIPAGESGEQYKREYAVLYLFDKDGNFTEAKHEFAGTTDALLFDIESKIQEMVAKLGETEFCDIVVKPFQVKIDGFIFGLVPDETSQMIELQPSNAIAFSEPWEGEYWT